MITDRRRWLLTMGGAALASAAGVVSSRGSGPRANVLLIPADDLHWAAASSFGGTIPDLTPNIDALARQGMRFQNAHVTVAVCTPSRSVLLTGRYPHRSGVEGFQRINEGVPVLPAILGEAGYLCGIIGKPLGQQETFQWSYSYRYPHSAKDAAWGRDPSVFYRVTREFLTKAGKAGRPFFLMANPHDPHRPFHGSVDETRRAAKTKRPREAAPPSRVYRADEVTVPGFLPDLPQVREEMAQYCTSIRRCDDTVGKLLQALTESGQEANTIVIFLSDNGMPFPFAKTNCYPHSTRTPLIFRWPGRIVPDSNNERRLVSGIDFMPTVLDALSIPRPAGMDGASFLGTLMGKEQPGPQFVFTQFHHIHGDSPYPMRAIQNRRFIYIFNPWSDGRRVYSAEPLSGLTFPAMKQAATTNARIAGRVKHLEYRTVEEFYDLEADPDALSNVVAVPAYRKQVGVLRQALDSWMQNTGDPALGAFRNRTSPAALARFMSEYTAKAVREIEALKAYEQATGYRF